MALAANEEPSGTLRVTSAVDFGVEHLSKIVSSFVGAYPNVTVDMSVSDEKLDLVESRIDLSIRTGWLEDSSYIARKVKDFRQMPVCAPKFLANHGSPREPQGLCRLPFVQHRALKNPCDWRFAKEEANQDVSFRNPVISVDVTLAAKSIALAGNGFTILPDFVVIEELRAGSLVPLVADWSLPSGGIYTVSPPSNYRNATLRYFLQFLQKYAGECL